MAVILLVLYFPSCVVGVVRIRFYSYLSQAVLGLRLSLAISPLSPESMIVAYLLCHLVGVSSACTNPLLYGLLNSNFNRNIIKIIFRTQKAFQIIFFITECFLFWYTPFWGIMRSSWTFYLGVFLALPELTVQLWRTKLVRLSRPSNYGAPNWCAIVDSPTMVTKLMRLS